MSIKFGVLANPLARCLANWILLIETFKYAVIDTWEKWSWWWSRTNEVLRGGDKLLHVGERSVHDCFTPSFKIGDRFFGCRTMKCIEETLLIPVGFIQRSGSVNSSSSLSFLRLALRQRNVNRCPFSSFLSFFPTLRDHQVPCSAASQCGIYRTPNWHDWNA